MEAAGLHKLMDMCREFGYTTVDTQLELITKLITSDETALREILDQETLKDYANLQDVYDALVVKTDGTKARDYFLSSLQHLLLIREDGPALVHYFQLVDSVVTDIVLSKKLPGSENRLGISVQQIIAQLNETDRFQAIEDQAAEARASALELKLQNEALQEEIAQGANGMVGQLKRQLSGLQDKLEVSRKNSENLQGRLEEQRVGYEERISQLEAQILELFRMLKEVGQGVERIVDNGSLDRKAFMVSLEKQLQRNKTISILEGRRGSRHKKPGERDTDNSEKMDSSEPEIAPPRTKISQPLPPNGPATRDSQFMDADETVVQEHIEHHLTSGALVSHFKVELYYVLTFLFSCLQEMGLFPVYGLQEALQSGLFLEQFY